MKYSYFILAVLLFFISSCHRGDEPEPTAVPTPVTHEVEYIASVSVGLIDVFYTDENDVLQEVQDAASPWSTTFTAEEGASLTLAGYQNGAAAAFSVTVTINVDGETVATQTNNTSASTFYDL